MLLPVTGYIFILYYLYNPIYTYIVLPSFCQIVGIYDVKYNII